MTDREFAANVLHAGLGARHVGVGFDNSFGRPPGARDHARLRRRWAFGVSVPSR